MRLSENKIVGLFFCPNGVVLSDNSSKKSTKISLPSNHSDKPDNRASSVSTAKAFFEGIVQCLKQKNFVKAEQFFDKLVGTNPKSISAIRRTRELIDQRKIACMDYEKIRPFAEFFNQLTNSEAATFYYALKDFVVRPNQPVFQQGSCDNRLYFIRSGHLKLKYFDYQARKNVTIATLRQGDIAGIETFFMLTNHTTNLIASEMSEISCLEKSVYQKIVAENHLLEKKLFKYCEAKQVNYQPKQPETLSRRAHQRYKADFKVQVQRFSSNGLLLEEVLNANVMDLSVGGLSYRARNLKIGEASTLHNSRVRLTASYQKYSLAYELKKIAKVVSVKFLPLGECSVHVQFEEPMDEETVMEIAHHTSVTAYI